jgi:hypothetical protein
MENCNSKAKGLTALVLLLIASVSASTVYEANAQMSVENGQTENANSDQISVENGQTENANSDQTSEVQPADDGMAVPAPNTGLQQRESGESDSGGSIESDVQGRDNLNNQQNKENFFNHQEDSIYGKAIDIACHFCDFGSDKENKKYLDKALEPYTAEGSTESGDNSKGNSNNQQYDNNFNNQQDGSVYGEEVTVMCHYIGDELCRPR